jgi:para-nitrobenzyl esterase
MWFAMSLMQESSPDDLRREFELYAGPVKGTKLFEVYRRMLPEASTAQLRERFLTHAIYRVPAVRTALAHNAAGGRAFVYRFDWESPFMQGRVGACHGLDETFVWGAINPNQNGLVDDRPETRHLSREMTDTLYRFAATGEPGWQIYAPGEPATRLFGGSGEILADVDSDFLAGWDGVERN